MHSHQKGGDRMKIKFNYSKLLGRMRECGYTQNALAEAIGITKQTLSEKLHNKRQFTGEEMYRICEVLNIALKDIGKYFFVI